MAQDLETRIARLESREEIRALCSRYSLAVDNKDFDTLATLFTRDAEYGWVDQPPQAVGCDKVVEMLRSRIAPGGPSFHVNHDTFVDWDESDPDRASGMVFCHAEVSVAAGHLVGAIRYIDKYAREDGRWKFAQRFLSFLYFTPPEQYSGILAQKDRLRHLNPPKPGHWPQGF